MKRKLPKHHVKWSSIFALYFCSILLSSAGIAQISLNAVRTPAINVMRDIERQSGYNFVYDESNMRFPKISVSVRNASVEEALSATFKNTGITYRIIKKNILIKYTPSNPVARTPSQRQVAPVLVQEYSFSGRLVTEKGIPLEGASIQIKDSKIMKVSDSQGYFILKGAKQNPKIIISFVGYQTLELSGSSDMGEIVMKDQPAELAEVNIELNTGYQTISKERATGSFSSLPIESLEQQRLSSLPALLEGRIPGYNNGLIRGTTSMGGITNPLYVVDGFPIENNTADGYGLVSDGIPGLNLEDIASITILKDAAAASIYGARAANGVIVIVTKKGKQGKPQISASSTFTTSPYRYYTGNLTSSADLIDLEKEWAASNSSLQGPDAATYAQSLLDNVAYPSQGIKAILGNYTGAISDNELSSKLDQLAAGGFRYYDDVSNFSKRNPFYQQYNVSVGMATGKNNFYGSTTYKNNHQEDRYAGDKQLGINLKNTAQINSWLTLDLGTYLDFGRGTDQSYNTLSPRYTYMPYDGLVSSDGSYYTSPATDRFSVITMAQIADNGLYNMDLTPLSEQGLNLNQSKSMANRSFIRLKADISEWLSYTPSFQYEYVANRSNQFNDKSSYYVRNLVNSFASIGTGSATFNLPYGHIDETSTQFTNAYTFRHQLNMEKTFAEKHNVTAIAGSEIRNTKMEFDSKTMYNYDPQMLTSSPINEELLSNFYDGILGYPTLDRGQRSEIMRRFFSVYANAGYSYSEKYMVTASVRWDRSNLWSSDSKYQNKPIWSAGLAWNMDREEFFKADWVDRLKLRLSYGIGGNVDPNTAPFITANYFPNYNLGGQYGIIANRPNPLLSWELTATTNIGIDFGMFNNRLTGSLDYYDKRGKDLLANTDGVPTEGFSSASYKVNNGEMFNKGVEIGLSGDLIRSGAFNWNMGIQYAYNKNEVSYVNAKAPWYVAQLDMPTSYPRIGNPYNAIYSYKWAGLNEQGVPQVYDENGEKLTYSPGTVESIIYSGTTVPTYSGSVSNRLDYKNFSLSFLLTFEGGHKMRNTFLPMLTNSYNSNMGGYVTKFEGVNKDIANRWKSPGDENTTDIPRVVFAEDPNFNSESADIYRYADINIIDASNIRLRNVSLAYNMPTAWAKRAHLQNIRLQFNMENAFTIARSQSAKYMLGGFQTPNYVWGIYLNF